MAWDPGGKTGNWHCVRNRYAEDIDLRWTLMISVSENFSPRKILSKLLLH